MSPYRVQYNESEYDILNYIFFYKNIKKKQNTFETLENLKKHSEKNKRNNSKNHLLFCIMYKFHNSYFIFVYVYIYTYIFIYLII